MKGGHTLHTTAGLTLESSPLSVRGEARQGHWLTGLPRLCLLRGSLWVDPETKQSEDDSGGAGVLTLRAHVTSEACFMGGRQRKRTGQGGSIRRREGALAPSADPGAPREWQLPLGQPAERGGAERPEAFLRRGAEVKLPQASGRGAVCTPHFRAPSCCADPACVRARGWHPPAHAPRASLRACWSSQLQSCARATPGTAAFSLHAWLRHFLHGDRCQASKLRRLDPGALPPGCSA